MKKKGRMEKVEELVLEKWEEIELSGEWEPGKLLEKWKERK